MISGNQTSLSQDKGQPQSTYTAQTSPRAATTTMGKTAQSMESQAEMKSPDSGSNSALSRALVGGLIGAGLGLLAGRKLSEGFSLASKGVGKAFGTIGQGLGTTVKGVGEAAKSIGDGASHAVVGGTSEMAQNIVQGVQQVKSSTANAIQQTGEMASQTLNEAAKSVHSVTGEAKQAVMDESNYPTAIVDGIDRLAQSDFEMQSYTNPSLSEEPAIEQGLYSSEHHE